MGDWQILYSHWEIGGWAETFYRQKWSQSLSSKMGGLNGGTKAFLDNLK